MGSIPSALTRKKQGCILFDEMRSYSVPTDVIDPAMRNETKWAGGYIRYSSKGVPTYYIYKRVPWQKGPFERSTSCHTLKGAMVELEQFERLQEAYKSAEDRKIIISEALADAWLEWAAEKTDRKVLDDHTRKTKRRIILDWGVRLGGRDMRQVTLEDVVAVIDEVKKEYKSGPRYYGREIKHFYAFLRAKGKIETNADPVMGRLEVPQSSLGKKTGLKKAFPPDLLMEIYNSMPKEHRYTYATHLMRNTGWHARAYARFIKEEKLVVVRELTTMPGYAGTLKTPLEKWGGAHTVWVTKEVLESAKRARSDGQFAIESFDDFCRQYSEPYGVRLTPGLFRHLFISHALANGNDLAAVGTAVGHRNLSTTLIYVDDEVVPAPVKPR